MDWRPLPHPLNFILVPPLARLLGHVQADAVQSVRVVQGHHKDAIPCLKQTPTPCLKNFAVGNLRGDIPMTTLSLEIFLLGITERGAKSLVHDQCVKGLRQQIRKPGGA